MNAVICIVIGGFFLLVAFIGSIVTELHLARTDKAMAKSFITLVALDMFYAGIIAISIYILISYL